MPPDWTTLDHALDRALDLEPAARAAFVDALAPEVRAALAPLLAAALADDPLLDRGANVLAPAVAALAADGPAGGLVAGGLAEGVRVGPYRVEALVGEGGMGRVYRARRADGAYDRVVALKVVRQTLALAGADVAERLRRERALLAALDHPGIARLVDGGETADGVPYLVTEFVDGTPITAWADARGLGVAARVRLAVDVCRAVDHAHRRLVVHRDLTPSNVLVTEADGAPRAVVLDFGVARLLADDADAVHTRTGQRMLTPAYAAPELFDASAPVTTAADVYGLGALLYALLVGRAPHAGTAEAAREPTRPSRALAPEAARLARTLRGDLDTIVLRALAPDPARRYASAAALADDLERYLDGRPVDARPDSAAYVASRFVRRHRAGVASAAVAVLALVAGLGVALAALGQARAARTEALAQAARATEATAFLASLFAAADPSAAGRPDASARDVLDAGRARVAELAGEPALQAEVSGLLASAYGGLGAFETADSLAARAVAAADSALGPASPWPARLRAERARALLDLGRAAPAAALLREALAQPAADDALRVRAGRMLARALVALGRPEDALAALGPALAAARAAGDSAEAARVLNQTGLALADLGRAAEALPRFRESLALRQALHGPRAAQTTVPMANLGNALVALGRFDEARPLLAEVLAIDRATYGDAHPEVAVDLLNLGRVDLDRQRPAAAEPLLREALGLYRRLVPADHPERADAGRLLAVALANLGRCAEAEPLAREAAAALDAQAGSDAVDAWRARATVGRCLVARGRAAEGAALLRGALRALAADPLSSDAERALVRSYLPR